MRNFTSPLQEDLFQNFLICLRDIFRQEHFLIGVFSKAADADETSQNRSRSRRHALDTQHRIEKLSSAFRLLREEPGFNYDDLKAFILAGRRTLDNHFVRESLPIGDYEPDNYLDLAKMARSLGENEAAEALTLNADELFQAKLGYQTIVLLSTVIDLTGGGSKSM